MISTYSSANLLTVFSDLTISNSTLDGLSQCYSAIFSSRASFGINLFNSTIKNFNSDAINAPSESVINLEYSIIKDNLGHGINCNSNNSIINLSSSMLTNNNMAVYSFGTLNTNYSNITFNRGVGISLLGNSFSTIKFNNMG